MNAAAELEPTAYDAQRQAFANLLVRFTADRDALIASIQECEERLSTLAERVEGGADGAVGGDGAAPADGAALKDVQQLIDDSRTQLEQMVARIRSQAEHATERADEALRRLDTSKADGESLSVLSKEIRDAVDEQRAEITRLREWVGERAAKAAEGDPSGPSEDFVRLGGRIDQVERDVAGLRARLEEIVEAARRQRAARESGTLGGGILGLQGAAMDDLREQVRALQAGAEWAPGFRRLWLLLLASILSAALIVVLGGVH